MKNKVHEQVIKRQLHCPGNLNEIRKNLKFGDQLCGFHVSQLFLQELATMNICMWFSSGPVESLVNRHK